MDSTKRIAIFVLYNKNGKLTKDVEYLIHCLKEAVNKLVIVVNGELEEYERLNLLADYLIIRENKGFDAGAYKTALFNDDIYEMVLEFEELIFCNDTFYGPFISFKEIFKRMENSKADFWGINLSDNGVITFIQSYFMLFKRQVWESGNLKFFFETMIDEDTVDFNQVLFKFERGIFDFLVKRGYKYDALNLQRYHICSAVDGSICYEKVPLLKKKAFSEQFYVKEKMLNALHYIEEHYDYDINLILEDIKERYLLVLDYDTIKKHKILIRSDKLWSVRSGKESILRFVGHYEKAFIYGAGKYGKLVKEFIGEEKVAGYIVSDNQRGMKFLDDIPVYEVSYFKEKKDIPVIVALNKKNRKQVEGLVYGFEKKIYFEED